MGRKIRIFSLGRKNNILKKKSVVSKYDIFSLNRITKYKLFAHVIFCGT